MSFANVWRHFQLTANYFFRHQKIADKVMKTNNCSWCLWWFFTQFLGNDLLHYSIRFNIFPLNYSPNVSIFIPSSSRLFRLPREINLSFQLNLESCAIFIRRTLNLRKFIEFASDLMCLRCKLDVMTDSGNFS